ncbi:hypothetical protein Q5752_006383 [Cryptotrichosporon argae]
MREMSARTLSDNGAGRSRSLESRLSEISIEEGEVVMDDSDDESVIADDEDDSPVVHVEVRLFPHTARDPGIIKNNVEPWLREQYGSVQLGTSVPKDDFNQIHLFKNAIEQMRIAQGEDDVMYVSLRTARVDVHVYQPVEDDESTFSIGQGEDEAEAEVAAATVTTLPCQKFDGLWDNLIYGDDIKPYLLDFVRSTLTIADAASHPDVIACNRVILLHGPPGTGKTSLCRAISQKAAIRLSDRYQRGKLIEINSHSLFSKWFSESGKLVQKLFTTVGEMADDEDCFVVVMIDEVESLTAARAGAMSGNEPTDALRVVNALLTQLDKLKARKNVLVVATSNMAHGIDSAFVSRADIVRHVPNPAPQAVYWILVSTLDELARVGLLRARNSQSGIFDWGEMMRLRSDGVAALEAELRAATRPAVGTAERKLKAARASIKLGELADLCQTNGVSARALRRLPVLALAKYVKEGASLTRWVDAYEAAVKRQLADQAKIEDGKADMKPGPGKEVGKLVKVEAEGRA